MKTIFTAVLLLTLFGCASIKTDVQNDPTFSPIGNRVSLMVVSKEQGNISESIFGNQIIDAAKKWLIGKGYVVVSQKYADQAVLFAVEQQNRDVYVPPQTLMMPVYENNNSNTTTTVKDAYGQKLGTLETSSGSPYNFGPTGYQSVQTGGYNAQVTDRWLLMFINSQKYGSQPRQVSRGNAYPEQRDQQFFESPQVMASAVTKLLNDSPLATAGKAPANLQNKATACWARIGLTYNSIEQAQIVSIAKGSNAGKAGLRVGDTVISINGQYPKKASNVKYTVDQTARIVASRNGKEFAVEVLPTMQCLDE